MAVSEKIELGLPEKLEIVRHGLYLEIIRKWFGKQFIFLTAFAIFWDGFLFFWYSNAVTRGNLVALLFPVLHLGVGFGLTYYVIAVWFNRSTFMSARVRWLFTTSQYLGSGTRNLTPRLSSSCMPRSEI